MWPGRWERFQVKDTQASPTAVLKGQVGGKGDPSGKLETRLRELPGRQGWMVGTRRSPEVDEGSGGGGRSPQCGGRGV